MNLQQGPSLCQGCLQALWSLRLVPLRKVKRKREGQDPLRCTPAERHQIRHFNPCLSRALGLQAGLPVLSQDTLSPSSPALRTTQGRSTPVAKGSMNRMTGGWARLQRWPGPGSGPQPRGHAEPSGRGLPAGTHSREWMGQQEPIETHILFIFL